MKWVLNNRLRFTPRNRAFTLIEVMIAVTISTMIMATVVSVMLISGRLVKDLFSKTQTRSAQMQALDQVRYRLCDASMASVTTVGANGDANGDGVNDGYREIRFKNPNLGSNITSRFFFDAAKNTLYYDDDMSDGNDNMAGYNDSDSAEGLAIAKGPIDVRFLPQNGNATIQLSIRSEGYIAYKKTGVDAQGNATYTVVDDQDGISTIYLRNP